LLFVNSAE
jgi:hypothetical protein